MRSFVSYAASLLGLLLAVLLGLASSRSAQAQIGPLRYGAALSATAGSGETLPFWLAANRYGTIDPQSAQLGLRVHLRRPFTGTGRIDYAAGADLLGRASDRATLHAHQLYGALRVRPLELTLGRYEQMIGRVDTTLSMGSVTWSRNATPPPKLSLGTVGYISVPGTRDLLAVTGYIAHGWLGANRFVEDAWLHEKYLYLRLLSPSGPVTLHGGLTHHVMWGGTHPRLGPQPRGLGDFFDLLLGGRNDEETSVPSTPSFANHLASYDFSAELSGSEWRALLYRQFYHEDTPSLAFRNPWDGLWGMSLRRTDRAALVEGFLWEHLVMTRHNAKYSEGEERGQDTYYNHSVYHSGWTYAGRTLGLPLLRPNPAGPGIGNNIVVAHHVGLEGTLPGSIHYRLMGTYSRNYGAQKVCADAACSQRLDQRTERRDQYAVALDVSGPLVHRYGLHYDAAVAFDTGALSEDRLGLSLGLSWSGSIRP